MISSAFFYICTSQQTFNKQLSQRYRNNRRRSNGTKCSKVVVLGSTEPSTTEPITNTTAQLEEEVENVEALRKLSKGKNPPAQMVQRLLDATRSGREKWPRTELWIMFCKILSWIHRSVLGL